MFNKHYKYTLKEDYTIFLENVDHDLEFSNEWIEIKHSWLTIKAGYSWDGCSPKIKIGKFVIGTWDGQMQPEGIQTTKYASLVHDALYQFLDDLEPLGLTRYDIDNEFLDIMNACGFYLADLYYFAVRLFGGLFRKFY